jgi:hypothetical protein
LREPTSPLQGEVKRERIGFKKVRRIKRSEAAGRG